MDITNRRKFFLNCSTWVKCTICDGHIPQVLFCPREASTAITRPSGCRILIWREILEDLKHVRGFSGYRKHKRHECPYSDVQVTGVRYRDRDSLLSRGHFRYTEKPVPTICRDIEEYIYLKEKRFPQQNCFSVSPHKIP